MSLCCCFLRMEWLGLLNDRRRTCPVVRQWLRLLLLLLTLVIAGNSMRLLGLRLLLGMVNVVVGMYFLIRLVWLLMLLNGILLRGVPLSLKVKW